MSILTSYQAEKIRIFTESHKEEKGDRRRKEINYPVAL